MQKIVSPVLDTALFVYESTSSVRLNDPGIQSIAKQIHSKIKPESYSPRSWRDHKLHLLPPDTISNINDPAARPTLDWIFLISALNFSFWSEYSSGERFAIEWREGWQKPNKPVKWTGYWSLVAALNRAIDEGIPITDPAFYASEEHCPDSLIEHVFRSSESAVERQVPLLSERIKIMREVGALLNQKYEGSFQNFLVKFHQKRRGKGTALELVQSIIDTFPSFRDQLLFKGREIFVWKRAQILVAEMWAAFYPLSDTIPHPILPGGVNELTMFADYRVPQILHHLGMLTYDAELTHLLQTRQMLASGSSHELSIRTASILAVEALKEAIIKLQADVSEDKRPLVNAVLLDFWLWDLAGEVRMELPHHRTRSIWY